MNAAAFALIAAILSPFIWGLMNVVDKYIVSHKVKNPLSFSAVVALVNILFGVIVSLFLQWGGLEFGWFIFPIIAGILYGSQFFFYYYILSKKDVSHMVGLLYVYPIILILLSFLFLNEIISFWGYLGIFLIIFGALMLSLHIKKIGLLRGFGLMIPFILCVAFAEFFMKVSTNNLPAWNGFAINLLAMGLTVLFVLFHKESRIGFPSELKNFKWALLSESLTFLGLLTIYLAMAGLSATIVTAIATLQPMTVLFFEFFAQKMVGKMAKDQNLIKKLVPILSITLGVILLYLNDIVKLIR